MKKKILISTGGSGGHVVPATILYDHLLTKADVVISTDKRGYKYLHKKFENIETINPPNITSTIIIGKSQYFFLTLKNSQNSLIKLILKLIFHFTFWTFFFNPIRFIFIVF